MSLWVHLLIGLVVGCMLAMPCFLFMWLLAPRKK